jgi:hypothetical protein
MLERIRGLTGFPERDVQVTVKQAQELAQIGAQLLKLHSEGVVDLGYFEKQSVIRLVDLVAGHAGDGDTRQRGGAPSAFASRGSGLSALTLSTPSALHETAAEPVLGGCDVSIAAVPARVHAHIGAGMRRRH